VVPVEASRTLGAGSTLAFGLPQVAMTAAATATATATGQVYATLRRHATYATLLTGTAALWTVAFTALGVVRDPILVVAATALFGFGCRDGTTPRTPGDGVDNAMRQRA